MNKIVVAIDGPAGAGKSTIARIIADKLNVMYIDTGAMYRAVTLSVINAEISLDDSDSIDGLLKNMELKLSDNKVFLNGTDVTEAIRLPEVSALVSPVSAIPAVRERLVELQREMASDNSVVMDGRDIGTNVLKNADVKIFLTASVEARACRRYTELREKGHKVNIDSIKEEITTRDCIDSSRKINPLVKAQDAIEIDTTQKSIDVVVDEILNIIRKR